MKRLSTKEAQQRVNFIFKNHSSYQDGHILIIILCFLFFFPSVCCDLLPSSGAIHWVAGAFVALLLKAVTTHSKQPFSDIRNNHIVYTEKRTNSSPSYFYCDFTTSKWSGVGWQCCRATTENRIYLFDVHDFIKYFLACGNDLRREERRRRRLVTRVSSSSLNIISNRNSWLDKAKKSLSWLKANCFIF